MPRDFLQGKFKPKHPEKYKGDINNIIFRSSWELAFFKWLDKNLDVMKWSSEELIIPYISPLDHRSHRYFTDALVTMRTKNGIKTFVIEIKPYNQTQEPKQGKRKRKGFINEVTTYVTNTAKWDAARKFCADNGFEFQILTEKNVNFFK